MVQNLLLINSESIVFDWCSPIHTHTRQCQSAISSKMNGKMERWARYITGVACAPKSFPYRNNFIRFIYVAYPICKCVDIAAEAEIQKIQSDFGMRQVLFWMCMMMRSIETWIWCVSKCCNAKYIQKPTMLWIWL